MDSELIAAYSSILGSVATFLSTIVALYLGLKKPRKSLSINSYFYKKSQAICGAIELRYLILAHDLNDEESDKRMLGFNVLNNCSEEIHIIGFIEQAFFNHSIETLAKWIKRISKRGVCHFTKHGFISVELAYGDRPYLFDDPVVLKPREQQLLCIDYDVIRATQINREQSGLFNLEKPLTFYALDVDGNRFRVAPKIPAENFIRERKCQMIKRNWLDSFDTAFLNYVHLWFNPDTRNAAEFDNVEATEYCT